jgi:tetratricopeptide (TPR) repeat protein
MLSCHTELASPPPRRLYFAAMARPARFLLLGAFAALALAALLGGAWLVASPPRIETAEASLPLPPEPPRFAEGPEADRCFALLRTDAEAAQAFARDWEAQGGADGAQHCAALALLARGDIERAAEQLEALARRSGAGKAARAAVFAQAAQAWLMAAEPARAFAATTLALSLTPDDVELLIDRAAALGTMERFGEAVADLDRALASDPGRPDALVFRAAAWRNLDRAEPARRDVEQALALDPGNAEALLERGILRQLAGDTEGARMDWERAIEIAPHSAAADLAFQNLALNEAGPAAR